MDSPLVELAAAIILAGLFVVTLILVRADLFPLPEAEADPVRERSPQ